MSKTSGDGKTPLMIAVENSDIESMRSLVAIHRKCDYVNNNMGNTDSHKMMKIVDERGNNVFHFSAKTRPLVIETLFELSNEDKDLINQYNHEGLTPLHVACYAVNHECVKTLCCKGSINSTMKGDHGHPIFACLQSGSLECIKHVVEVMPKHIDVQASKDGGGPLHWVKSREAARLLLDKGAFDINLKNFRGFSPLHNACKSGRLDLALTFISYGADVNLQTHDYISNTPSHLSAHHFNRDILRALLSFQADFRIKNSEGQTVWDVAFCQAEGLISRLKSSKIMSMNIISLTNKNDELFKVIGILIDLFEIGSPGSVDVFKTPKFQSVMNFSGVTDSEGRKILTDLIYDENTSFNEARDRRELDEYLDRMAASHNNRCEMRKSCRLLSLDGGGVRGLVLCRQLLSFEEMNENTPTLHSFDWIGGCSTGGLVALAIAAGISVIEIQRLYLRLKDVVFNCVPGSSQTSSMVLEDLLKKEFGENLRLNDLSQGPRVFASATKANQIPPDIHFFRTYPSPQTIFQSHDCKDCISTKENEKLPDYVWYAVKSCCSAPYYFSPTDHFVDGALLSNNPSIDLLKEVNEFNHISKEATTGNPPTVLLSLGTGCEPVREVQVPDCSAGLLSTSLNNGMSLFNLLLSCLLHTDGPVNDQVRAWCLSSKTVFYRFSPPLKEKIEINTTDDTILVNLLFSTMVYMHKKLGRINIDHFKS